MESTGDGERQFRIEEVPLRNEDIQIVREPTFVPQIGEAQRRLQRSDLFLLSGGLLTGCPPGEARCSKLRLICI